MAFLDWLRKLLGTNLNPSLTFPVSKGTISYGVLYTLLGNYAKQVFLSDANFDLASLEDGQNFVKSTQIQYGKWVSEHHDCDNFSFELMGYFSEGLWSYAFGIAWTDVHAFNFMVDDKKQVWIVEPQTGKFTKVDDLRNNKDYFPWRIAIC